MAAVSVVDELGQAVEDMRRALGTITRIVTPQMSARDFHGAAGTISAVDKLFHTQHTVRTTAGFLADKHLSGDQVGSRTPEAFITTLFQVSSWQARTIVARGRDTYKRVGLAVIRKELLQDNPQEPVDLKHETAEDRARRLERERELFEKAKRLREEQITAQQEAARLVETCHPSDEYLRILDRELKALVGVAHKQTIRAQALALIATMSPEDFRHQMRSRVRKTTGTTTDPRRSQKKRTITLGRPDSLGGAQLTGYLPAPSLAIFQHILASSRPIPSGDKNDKRHAGQRRHDQLMNVLATKTRYDSHQHGGIGSILVSITTQELENILKETTGTTLYELVYKPRPTNTSAMISLIELMNIGLASYDITCLHDSHSGNALHWGRTQRSATFLQKIALVAQELVCSYPGCDVPACLCDVHHITAWADGGTTDIDNLTFRCRNHHMDNNDHKNPALARGWAHKDPNTERTGHHSPPRATNPTIEINHSMKARQAAGYKIHQHHQQEQQTDNGSGLVAASGLQPPTGGSAAAQTQAAENPSGISGTRVPPKGSGSSQGRRVPPGSSASSGGSVPSGRSRPLGASTVPGTGAPPGNSGPPYTPGKPTKTLDTSVGRLSAPQLDIFTDGTIP